MELTQMISASEAAEMFNGKTKNILRVKNPGGVYPQFDYYPLKPMPKMPLRHLKAILLDMDGTITSTEEINLQTLEKVTRIIIPDALQKSWGGLDPTIDPQKLVGVSTSTGIEYLVGKYGAKDATKSFLSAYFSTVFALISGKGSPARQREIWQELDTVFGNSITTAVGKKSVQLKNCNVAEHALKQVQAARALAAAVCKTQKRMSFDEKVKCLVTVFCYEYGRALEMPKESEHVRTGNEKEIKTKRATIEPMTGVMSFLLLVKGCFDEKGRLLKALSGHDIGSLFDHGKMDLKKLLQIQKRVMRENPKLALVTSSTRYDAEIVLNQVFAIMRKQINGWNIPATQKKQITTLFNDPHTWFDTIVTADDSSEIRLKPHRDLYTIALMKLGIPETDFDQVIGFEDSTSGVMALRAAGVGVCLAVPLQEAQQKYDAAHFVLKGGLPEAISRYNMFLQ